MDSTNSTVELVVSNKVKIVLLSMKDLKNGEKKEKHAQICMRDFVQTSIHFLFIQ